MSEPIHSFVLKSGEMLVRDAVGPSGYSHSYIIRKIKDGAVEGRLIETVAGKIWVVNLPSLMVYKEQPHKTGPKGPIKTRKEAATPKGGPSQTEEAA